MVLINIEHLSDSELKYIAEQEELEDLDGLSREELIVKLKDFYEDENENTDVSTTTSDRKFIKALTETDSDVLPSPGVKPLPKTFNTTEISLINKDSDWAYVIWGIDKTTLERTESEKETLILRTIAMENDNFPRQCYDVEISVSDNTWNIEFPWKDRTYIIRLIAKQGTKETVLAETLPEKVPEIATDSNSSALKQYNRYKVLVSALISKEGECIDVEQVKRILNKLNKENTNEK